MASKLELSRADLEVKQQATDIAHSRLVQKGRGWSLFVTVAIHVIIALLMGLVFFLPEAPQVPQIVAVTNNGLEQDNLNKKDFARSMRQKPQPAQSASKVKPIASMAVSAVSMPTVEDPAEEPLGLGVDFGRGFGFGRGNGGGGGGGSMSFFGVPMKADSIVFLVDFSGSMKEADAAGGTRLQRLKRELVNSITKLPRGMPFQVIYYSHDAWLGGETLRSAPTRFADDPAHRIPWSRATKEGIDLAVANVKAAAPEGATLWGPPLALAMAMSPPPSHVWLLSDGEAQDGEEVLDEIKTINPNSIPINVIGLELAGPGFKNLVDIARVTGGTYSIVHKGKLYSGAASLRFATDGLDVDQDFEP